MVKDDKLSEIGNYQTDLQIPATEEILALVEKYDYPSSISLFNSVIDGSRWVEINFIYDKVWGNQIRGMYKRSPNDTD